MSHQIRIIQNALSAGTWPASIQELSLLTGLHRHAIQSRLYEMSQAGLAAIGGYGRGKKGKPYSLWTAVQR